MNARITGNKSMLKQFLFCTARDMGLLRLLERRMKQGITLLTYHRVLPDEQCRAYPLPSLAIPQSAFRDQVAWLKKRFCLLPVREALERKDATKPVVCLTFDDGYLDNFEIAAPVLDDAGVRGSFFITAGLMGMRRLLWFDRAALCWSRLPQAVILQTVTDNGATLNPWPKSLHEWVAALKRLSPVQRLRIVNGLSSSLDSETDDRDFALMDSEQVRQLHARGHEIGSHTLTHPLLPQLADEELWQELHDSKCLIESWINQPVEGLCYPNGDHDARIVAMAEAVGYRYGCTTLGGVNRGAREIMRLKRVGMNPGRVLNGAAKFDELLLRSELAVRQGR